MGKIEHPTWAILRGMRGCDAEGQKVTALGVTLGEGSEARVSEINRLRVM